MEAGKQPLPIETIAIMDVVATDVFVVEDMGFGMCRIVWTAPERHGDTVELHTTCKVVLPEACLLPISRKLAVAATHITESMGLTLVPDTGRNHAG